MLLDCPTQCISLYPMTILLVRQCYYYITNPVIRIFILFCIFLDFKVVFVVLLAGNINVYIFTGGLFLTIWKKIMTSKFAQAMGRFFINRLLLIPIE